MTSYDNFDTYQKGDDWDYNQEFTDLFEDRVPKGPVADRPSAADAPDGAVWVATDQQLVYRNDATNGWVVEGHGSDANPVPEQHVKTANIEELNSTHWVQPSDDLQTRITEAGANSHIFVSPGVHEFTFDATAGRGLELTNDNVTLEVLENAVVKLADGEIGSGDNGDVVYLQGTNITLTGDGWIDGNRANNTNNGTGNRLVRVDAGSRHIDINVDCRNSTGMGIKPDGAADNKIKDVHIHDLTLENTDADGILWHRADYVIVENCTLDQIYNQDGIEPAVNCAHWIVANNTIHSTGQSAVDVYGGASNGYVVNNICDGSIRVGDDVGRVCEDVVVARNTITAAVSRPLTSDSATDANRVTFLNNLVDQQGTSGRAINHGNRGTVEGNIVVNAGDVGIRSDGADVRKNEVYSPGGVGIRAYAPSIDVSFNRVEGAGARGIEGDGSNRKQLLGNIVLDSATDNIRTSGDYDRVLFNTAMRAGQGGSNSTGLEVSSAVSPKVFFNVALQDGATNQATGIHLNNTTDAESGWNNATAEFTAFNDGGTRSRRNGVIELGGAPTDSNYTTRDAGVTVLDTSTSPPTEYKVMADGTTSTVQ